MSEFCEICGLLEGEHPTPKPGPPQPPPLNRPEGELWRPPHKFRSSGLTFAEVLNERDAQIDHWRRRTYRLHHQLNRVRAALGVKPLDPASHTEEERT